MGISKYWIKHGGAIALSVAVLSGCGGGHENSVAPESHSVKPKPDTQPPVPRREDEHKDDKHKLEPNVVSMKVERGPFNVINTPTVSVKVCLPASSNLKQPDCQIIDHIMVDTASVGLRLKPTALTLRLPKVRTASGTGRNSKGGVLTECALFTRGRTYGSVRLADIELGGESASDVPIQVMFDPAYQKMQTKCPTPGRHVGELSHKEIKSEYDLQFNGVLGVDVFKTDLNPKTSKTNEKFTANTYFLCDDSLACNKTSPMPKQQIANPVAAFKAIGNRTADNNGIIVHLPQVPEAGADSVTGALIFGINTRDNNKMPVGHYDPIPVKDGYITIVARSKVGDRLTFPLGSINSGLAASSLAPSNYYRSFLYGNDWFSCDDSHKNAKNASNEKTLYGGLICSQSPKFDIDVTFPIAPKKNYQFPVHLTVASADPVFETNHAVFKNIAFLGEKEVNEGRSTFGLPFFFGRSVYFAFEGSNNVQGINHSGPFIDFVDD